MLSLSLHEKHLPSNAEFPVEYHYVDKNHPRFNMPTHWHQEWEILMILQGSAVFRINEYEVLMHEGDFLLISEGLLHSGMPESDGCIYECIVFPLSGLFAVSPTVYKSASDIFSAKQIPQVFYPKCIYPYLANQVRQLMDTCRSINVDYSGKNVCLGQKLITIGCMSQILGQILFQNLFEKEIRLDTTSHIAKIKNTLDYIEQKYDTQITLKTLASAANISPKYFCEIFRQITQKTPMEYVIFFRIEQACIMLNSSSNSITEISLLCGFNDSGYFARRFKQQIGMTPSQYRKHANQAYLPTNIPPTNMQKSESLPKAE